jgi:histone arginine demethylase JMJD6
VGRLELQESLKLLKASRLPVRTECLAIDRCEYGSISYSQFLDKYSIPTIPLIFTSAGPHILPSHYTPSATPNDLFSWSLESLMKTLGEYLVIPKHYVEESDRWAKQEDLASCKLSTILSASFPETFGDSPAPRSLNYLVDWSLPHHCPHLFESSDSPIFNLPKYFAMDLLQLCPEGSLYKDSWPSLFIGPKDSLSSLHVDTFGSNFWMFLIHGRKKWRFYSPDDLCALSPMFPSSFEPVFSLSEEEIERTGIQYYEVVLNPGELIFVPSGSPHSVLNLEGTVAISCNYLDESNIQKSLDTLGKYGLTCQRSLELKQSLERICPVLIDANGSLKDLPYWIERRQRGDSLISSVPWSEFKGNHTKRKRKLEEECE